jgi:hypothetical protein
MKLHQIFLAAALALGAVTAAPAAILLSDDFNDNSLDGTKWTTNTTLSDPYGTPSVVEQNQRLEIHARGYLNTLNNYDPSALGGLKLQITGTWTFLNVGPGDLPAVITRSDGTPTPYFVGSGEVTNGITFRIQIYDPGVDGINIYGNGAATVTNFSLISNTLNLVQGDSVNFTVVDDGTNLSFNVAEVGDPSSAASATAICASLLATNKVSFYNRESDGNTVALDNALIQAVPETSTWVCGLLTTSAVIGWHFRRRTRRATR